MATKPSKRILDWASGGTATDPGGAKEAAGWVVSERPPAFWWNWILQSFGDWLSWSEDEIDEFPATVRTRVLGRIHSPGGSVDTPAISTNTTDVGIDTPQSGDVTSTTIMVRFTTAFSDALYTPIVTNAYTTGYVWTVETRTTTTMTVSVRDITAGAVVNPLTTSTGFYMDIKGAQ